MSQYGIDWPILFARRGNLFLRGVWYLQYKLGLQK